MPQTKPTLIAQVAPAQQKGLLGQKRDPGLLGVVPGDAITGIAAQGGLGLFQGSEHLAKADKTKTFFNQKKAPVQEQPMAQRKDMIIDGQKKSVQMVPNDPIIGQAITPQEEAAYYRSLQKPQQQGLSEPMTSYEQAPEPGDRDFLFDYQRPNSRAWERLADSLGKANRDYAQMSIDTMKNKWAGFGKTRDVDTKILPNFMNPYSEFQMGAAAGALEKQAAAKAFAEAQDMQKRRELLDLSSRQVLQNSKDYGPQLDELEREAYRNEVAQLYADAAKARKDPSKWGLIKARIEALKEQNLLAAPPAPPVQQGAQNGK